jgi:hypothetical protein
MSEQSDVLTAKSGKPDDKPNHVRLIVVVNTVDTEVEANIHWKLQKVAETALSQTGTTSKDLSDWRLKDSGGAPLDFNRSVESYGFESGTELFLSLDAGANG